MKIKNRKNYLTSLPEGTPPPQPRQKYTQWAYFSVILFILGFIVYFTYDYNTHFFGSGRIEADKTHISSSHSGIIKTLHVEARQLLQRGDSIATIKTNQECGVQDSKNIEKLRYDIALKESHLRLLRNGLPKPKKVDSADIIRRALEINNSKSLSSTLVDRERLKQTQAIALLKSEVDIKNRQLRNAEINLQTHTPASCGQQIITAPFDAMVFMLQQRGNEFINKGDTIAILSGKNATVYVNAKFDKQSQHYFKRGDVLDVELSDGWSTQGTISDIFSPTFEDKKRLFSMASENYSVWVRLVPVDETSRQRWLDNDLMSISVRGKK